MGRPLSLAIISGSLGLWRGERRLHAADSVRSPSKPVRARYCLLAVVFHDVPPWRTVAVSTSIAGHAPEALLLRFGRRFVRL
jgi:hypothetical protein